MGYKQNNSQNNSQNNRPTIHPITSRPSWSVVDFSRKKQHTCCTEWRVSSLHVIWLSTHRTRDSQLLDSQAEDTETDPGAVWHRDAEYIDNETTTPPRGRATLETSSSITPRAPKAGSKQFQVTTNHSYQVPGSRYWC